MKFYLHRTLSLVLALAALSVLILPSMADQSVSVPEVSAKSAVLAEGESGTVIWSKNGDEKLPMASTTKIMTALVALERCSDLDREVKIPSEACGIEGSSIYLKEGERLTMRQLLFALLLESANDAACAIAIETAGSIDKFAGMMNETAASIGMNSSHFTNPHGLDNEEHYTTASDMAKLAVYALKNDNFAQIVSTYKTTIPMNGGEGTRLLLNHNKLLKYYDGAVGVKTGFTKRSGRCLVSAAERDGITMIAVTLSAPDDWNDHCEMLDYGFSKYKRVDLASPGSVSYSIPVTGGDSEVITISNRDSAHLCLPSDTPELTCVIEAPRFLYAPIAEGDVIGYACYLLGEEELARIPLYSENDSNIVKKPSLWERILEMYK